ncbi:MAG: hypothetical protein K8R18_11625 [Parvibaculum sp.]|uniref:hypothetical protein n=1 Tax=Parvibaculum sp. TaxID=2024848 RepID=UPI0025F1F638|nr:hypothetical protein [Parvibaculum sp.]MCE9650260.1 hypothetical protein [Parvibaculum sp.]
MKTLWLGIAAAILVAMPAAADTVDSTYGNTLVATNAKGETAHWFIDADNTFKIVGADGKEVAGTWKIAGDKFCITPAGSPENCFTYVTGKNVGDSWDVRDGAGEAVKVSIVSGR